MKTIGKSVIFSLCLAAVIIAGCLMWQRRKKDEPRRRALQSIAALNQGLDSSSASLLDQVIAPTAVQGRTPKEQTEFIVKALRDEVSPEGIAMLKKVGRFGHLQEIFPEEAGEWAKRVGVKSEDCMAFRAEHNGIRAEVVLLQDGTKYRIVRLNNVKQLASN